MVSPSASELGVVMEQVRLSVAAGSFGCNVYCGCGRRTIANGDLIKGRRAATWRHRWQ